MRPDPARTKILLLLGLCALVACEAPTEPDPQVVPSFAKGGNPGPPDGGGEQPSAYTLTIVDGACPPSCSTLEVLSGISSTGLITGNIGVEPTLWDTSLTAYPLGRLGGYETYPYAISPGGTHVVGERWLSEQRPVFWTLSGTTVVSSGLLPLLPGYVSGVAMDVNDAGEAVGYLNPSGNPSGAAVLWEADGTPRELGSLAGYDRAWAAAINGAGHVVGWFSASGLQSRAVLWIVDGPGLTQVDLTPLSAESARALDLTEPSGGVIYVSGTQRIAGTSYAAVWTVDALTGSVLGVATGPQGNEGRSINSNLEVTSGQEVWDALTDGVETLPVLDDRCVAAGTRDVNDAGVIVGVVGERYRGGCYNRLAIWTPVTP